MGLILGSFFAAKAQESRDPSQWPFAANSIWNMPIGSEAEYVHAHIPPVTEFCPHADEDVIILKPGAPLTEIYHSAAGWSSRDRCEKSGNRVLMEVPIPGDFIADPPYTPNMSAAILDADGQTIHQTQPFHRCAGSDHPTSMVNYPSVDIYGDGIEGAHGGSGMSSIGGTIRLGELVPGGRVRHALKCSIRGQYAYYYDEETKGYRWPAVKSDGYASRMYGKLGQPVKECRMGALLAIPWWMDIDSMGFQTEPGRILARACQEYGIYAVDDCGTWDTYQICTEWSPEGRVEDEFRKSWGFPFTVHKQPDLPWWQDVELLFMNLYVVSNNGPDRIGGGGAPLVPTAPGFSTDNP